MTLKRSTKVRVASDSGENLCGLVKTNEHLLYKVCEMLIWSLNI